MRPKFRIALPYIDDLSRRSRLARTVESVLNQTALSTHEAEVQLTIACGYDEGDLRDFVVRRFGRDFLDLAPDEGLYDAIGRVFRGATADYFGWLGAGDVYEPCAFSIVLENSPPAADEPYWITGMMVGRRTDGAVVRANLPLRYKRRFFECGLYGTVLPSVQQESTFWNHPLNRHIDFDRLATFRSAGDFSLWLEFSRVCEPVIVEAVLGSFQWHGDNLSADYDAYVAELRSLTRNPSILERAGAQLERLGWALHPAIKLRLSGGQVRRYAWPDGPWESQRKPLT